MIGSSLDISDIEKMFYKKFGENYKILDYDDYTSAMCVFDKCLTNKEKMLNKLLNIDNYNIFYDARLEFCKYPQYARHIDISIYIIDDYIKIPISRIFEELNEDKNISEEKINRLFNEIDIIKKHIFEFNIDLKSIPLSGYSNIESDIFEKLKKYNTLNKNNITDFLNIKSKHCSQYLDYRHNIITAIAKDMIKTVNLCPSAGKRSQYL